MKLTSAIASIALATTLAVSAAQAATPGFYLGVQAGTARADESKLNNALLAVFNEVGEDMPSGSTLTYTSSEGGFSGRIFGGYNFTRYFGIEAGYSKIANNSYDITYSSIGNSGTSKLTLKTDAIDVVAKGYLPLDMLTDTLSENLNLYGKAGLAYVNHKAESSRSQTGAATITSTDSKKQYRPVFGVGASYNFTKEVAMDISYTRIQGKGDLLADGFKNYSPAVNMLALGVSYTFG